MHKPPISQLVYNFLYPRPRQNDPSSFAAHAARNLVAEVRVETANFYGALDCLEAQYPGLDYSFPPHRKRLGRFHHHRKLFRAFDELRLTADEISSLCQWEGTKFARERYEKNEGVTIRDTTLDTIRVAPPHVPPSVYVHSRTGDNSATLSYQNLAEGSGRPAGGAGHDTEEDTSDDDIESYGTRLNERLRRLAEARDQGAAMTDDDLELFEQWLKETIERGGHTDVLEAVRDGRPIDFTYHGTPSLSQAPLSSNMAASQTHSGAASQRITRMSGATLASGNMPVTPIQDPHNPTRRTM